MANDPNDGQLPTLGLLEQLRAESGKLWGASSDTHFRVDKLLRQLANPNLHDIKGNLPFRGELWDRHSETIRWVVSASANVTLAHAALESAIANYPGQRFALRNGIMLIREHKL